MSCNTIQPPLFSLSRLADLPRVPLDLPPTHLLPIIPSPSSFRPPSPFLNCPGARLGKNSLAIRFIFSRHGDSSLPYPPPVLETARWLYIPLAYSTRFFFRRYVCVCVFFFFLSLRARARVSFIPSFLAAYELIAGDKCKSGLFSEGRRESERARSPLPPRPLIARIFADTER